MPELPSCLELGPPRGPDRLALGWSGILYGILRALGFDSASAPKESTMLPPRSSVRGSTLGEEPTLARQCPGCRSVDTVTSSVLVCPGLRAKTPVWCECTVAFRKLQWGLSAREAAILGPSIVCAASIFGSRLLSICRCAVFLFMDFLFFRLGR